MDLLPRDIQRLIYGYITWNTDLQSLRLVCRRIRDLLPESVTHILLECFEDTGLQCLSNAGLNWLTKCKHLQDLDLNDIRLGSTVPVEDFLRLSSLPLRRIAMDDIELIVPFLLAYRRTHGIVGKMSQLRFNNRWEHKINTWYPGIPAFDGKILICQTSFYDITEWDLVSSTAEVLLDIIDFEYIVYDDFLRGRFYQKLFGNRTGANPVQGTLIASRLEAGSDASEHRTERFGSFMGNSLGIDFHIRRVAGVYEHGQLSPEIVRGVTELLQSIPIGDLENAIADYPLINRFVVEIMLIKPGILTNARQFVRESLSRHPRIGLIVICIHNFYIEDNELMSVRNEMISCGGEDRIRFMESFDRIDTLGKNYELPREACRVGLENIERRLSLLS